MANPPKSKATIIAPGKRYYGPQVLRPSTKYRRGGQRRDLYDPKKYTDLTQIKGKPPQAALRQEFQGVQGVPGAGLPQQGIQQPTQQDLLTGQSVLPEQPTPQTQQQSLWGRVTGWIADRWQQTMWAVTGGGSGTYNPPGVVPGEERGGTDLLAIGAMGSIGIGGFGAGGAAFSAPKIGKAAKNTLHVTKEIAGRYRATGEITKAGTQIAANPKTWGFVSKLIIDAGIIGAGLGAIAGSVVFGKWQLNEALDNLKYVESEARKAGEFELAEYLRKEKYKVIEFSQGKAMSTPLLGSLLGNIENTKAALIATRAQDSLAKNEQLKIENNLTDADLFRQEAEQRELMKRETIDYYNEQSIIYAELEREARKQDRAEEAAFWKQHQIDIIKLAEEERERIAAFWLEYNKQKAKMMAENSPSQLNFGLL